MNPLNLISPQYRIAAKLAGLAALFIAGLLLGHEWRDRACDITVTTMQRDAEQAARDASEAARRTERDLLNRITTIEADHHEQSQAAEAERDRLLADIRAGDRRLRERFTCPGNVPGAATGIGSGDAGTESGLQREDAEFLVRLAADADAVTRQLNACQAVLREERK